jgi:hypothetical protein
LGSEGASLAIMRSRIIVEEHVFEGGLTASGNGMAETSGGGSATGFNDLASAGGLGSGSTTGRSASDAIETAFSSSGKSNRNGPTIGTSLSAGTSQIKNTLEELCLC